MTAIRQPRRAQLALSVQYAVAASNSPSHLQIGKWARAALEHDAKITVRIVGQSEGRMLNRNYRRKDYATNVLTFIFSDSPPFEGDLALCAPVITREARQQGISATAHYAHLVVHGVLHLQGYDHEKKSDARVMEKLESQIVSGLGYADPYEKDEEGRMGAQG